MTEEIKVEAEAEAETETHNSASIASFLSLGLPKAELATTLKVLRAFKNCESAYEFFSLPFVVWSKLEQLEEFLGYLVEGTELQADTIEQLALYNITPIREN